jgi:hypothetical protein
MNKRKDDLKSEMEVLISGAESDVVFVGFEEREEERSLRFESSLD